MFQPLSHWVSNKTVPSGATSGTEGQCAHPREATVRAMVQVSCGTRRLSLGDLPPSILPRRRCHLLGQGSRCYQARPGAPAERSWPGSVWPWVATWSMSQAESTARSRSLVALLPASSSAPDIICATAVGAAPAPSSPQIGIGWPRRPLGGWSLTAGGTEAACRRRKSRRPARGASGPYPRQYARATWLLQADGVAGARRRELDGPSVTQTAPCGY